MSLFGHKVCYKLRSVIGPVITTKMSTKNEMEDAIAALLKECDDIPDPAFEVTVVDEKPPPELMCPFHKVPLEDVESTLNRDDCDPCVRCNEEDCVVFSSKKNAEKVIEGLKTQMHSALRKEWHRITCKCGYRPNLSMSRSEKNPDRLLLSCSWLPKEDRCRFFQWIDRPMFRQREKTEKPKQMKSSFDERAENWKKFQKMFFMMKGKRDLRREDQEVEGGKKRPRGKVSHDCVEHH